MLSSFPNLRGFKRIFMTATLMGMGVSFVMAYVYVRDGQELVGNSQFLVIDGYIFSLSIAFVILFTAYHLCKMRIPRESAMMAFSCFYFLFSGWEDSFVYAVDTKSTMFKHLPHLEDSQIGLWTMDVLQMDMTGTGLLATMLTTLLVIYLPGMYILYHGRDYLSKDEKEYRPEFL